ncbi:MAG: carboxylating nicotinate-nucleotide diphosphorylase [Planctomycetota bacterium]|nr:carboxylating nicotinate-nucleotide diphosphorylase [Planctomycetota bacterium]
MPSTFPHGPAVEALIEAALTEDHAREDLTSAVLPAADRDALAEIRVKAPGIVCGLPLVARVFAALGAEVRLTPLAEDGETIGAGTVVMRVEGSARAILRAERTILNLLQRLSGVASHTARFAERILSARAQIYDTRKTTPGWRALEKYAVRCGGGQNHRLDLADAAMLKENHLVAAYGRTGPQSIAQGVRALWAALPPGVPLYVEVENAAELDAALEATAAEDRARLVLVLDEFPLAAIRAAVRQMQGLAAPRPQLEVSGGVTLDTVEALASTGVARISSGALTHSAPALDIALKIVPDERG